MTRARRRCTSPETRGGSPTNAPSGLLLCSCLLVIGFPPAVCVCPSLCWLAGWSVCLSVCLSVGRLVVLSVGVSVYPSKCLLVCLCGTAFRFNWFQRNTLSWAMFDCVSRCPPIGMQMVWSGGCLCSVRGRQKEVGCHKVPRCGCWYPVQQSICVCVIVFGANVRKRNG